MNDTVREDLQTKIGPLSSQRFEEKAEVVMSIHKIRPNLDGLPVVSFRLGGLVGLFRDCS